MHPAFMSKGETLADRLRRARIKKIGDEPGAPVKVARALGIPDPTYYGHENGSRFPETDMIVRYAIFFRVSTDWLLTGKGKGLDKLQVQVVGYIGAGAEVVLVDNFSKDQGLELVEPPPGIDFPCVAARIRGDSMHPFRAGWLVFWEEHPQGVTDDCIGQLCVVKLTDGRMLLKELRRGSRKAAYRLDSHNAPALEDAAVEWATRVLGFTMT